MNRKDVRRIVLPVTVAGIALLLRLIYLFHAADLAPFLSPGMDAEIYREWASAILAGSPPDGAFFRAPLYPYLIAFLGFLFNQDLFWPVRFLQILISAAAAGLLAALARSLFNKSAGWIAGITWALYGLSIYFDNEGLITSLYTSTFIVLLSIMHRYYLKPNLITASLLGLLAGVLTLLRANALLFWPVILTFLFLQGTSRKQYTKKRFLSPVLALLLSILMISPVLYYNATRGGGFSISTQGGINLFLGNNPGASGAFAVDPDCGKSWTRDQVTHRASLVAGKTLNDAEVSSFYNHQALKFWQTQPQNAGKLFIKKALLTVNWREIGNNRTIHPFLKEVHSVFAFLATIGFPVVFIVGMASLPFLFQRTMIRYFALFLLLHGLFLVLYFVNARYRFPIVPVLVLFAAGGITTVLTLQPSSGSNIRRKLIFSGSILITALLCLLPDPLPGALNTRSEWLYHKATANYRLNKYSVARECYYDLLKEYPVYRDAHLNLGVCHLMSGNPDSALVHFVQEIKRFPDNPRALNNIAILAEKNGDLISAILYYRQALQFDPTNNDARLNLANALHKSATSFMEEEDFQAAMNNMAEAIRLAPENPAYAVNFALANAAAGKTEEALDVLRKAKISFPEFPPIDQAIRQVQIMQE